MNPRILCVDDEPKVLRALRRKLHGQFTLDLAEGPVEALGVLNRQGPYAVVLSDMRMPGMDGVQFLAEVQKRTPDTVRIMLTGNADLSTAVRAVNEGNIFRFLTKPCDPEDLTRALQSGLEQYRLVRAEKELLEGTLNGSVKVLTEILSIVDPGAFGRAIELRDIAGEVARGLDMKQPWEVEVALMLSQLGRVTIPPELLAKSDAGHELTAEEKKMLARVPETGGSLISHIPRMASVAKIVKWQRAPESAPADDEQVRLGAGILKILGEFSALESGDGSWSSALRLIAERDKHHDPIVFEAALASLRAAVGTEAGDERTPIALAFEDLAPGHVLAAPIETVEGRCIIREGHKISHVLLTRLANHREISAFKEPIYVDPGSTPERRVG